MNIAIGIAVGFAVIFTIFMLSGKGKVDLQILPPPRQPAAPAAPAAPPKPGMFDRLLAGAKAFKQKALSGVYSSLLTRLSELKNLPEVQKGDILEINKLLTEIENDLRKAVDDDETEIDREDLDEITKLFTRFTAIWDKLGKKLKVYDTALAPPTFALKSSTPSVEQQRKLDAAHTLCTVLIDILTQFKTSGDLDEDYVAKLDTLEADVDSWIAAPETPADPAVAAAADGPGAAPGTAAALGPGAAAGTVAAATEKAEKPPEISVERQAKIQKATDTETAVKNQSLTLLSKAREDVTNYRSNHPTTGGKETQFINSLDEIIYKLLTKVETPLPGYHVEAFDMRMEYLNKELSDVTQYCNMLSEILTMISKNADDIYTEQISVLIKILDYEVSPRSIKGATGTRDLLATIDTLYQQTKFAEKIDKSEHTQNKYYIELQKIVANLQRIVGNIVEPFKTKALDFFGIKKEINVDDAQLLDDIDIYVKTLPAIVDILAGYDDVPAEYKLMLEFQLAECLETGNTLSTGAEKLTRQQWSDFQRNKVDAYGKEPAFTQNPVFKPICDKIVEISKPVVEGMLMYRYDKIDAEVTEYIACMESFADEKASNCVSPLLGVDEVTWLTFKFTLDAAINYFTDKNRRELAAKIDKIKSKLVGSLFDLKLASTTRNITIVEFTKLQNEYKALLASALANQDKHSNIKNANVKAISETAIINKKELTAKIAAAKADQKALWDTTRNAFTKLHNGSESAWRKMKQLKTKVSDKLPTFARAAQVTATFAGQGIDYVTPTPETQAKMLTIAKGVGTGTVALAAVPFIGLAMLGIGSVKAVGALGELLDSGDYSYWIDMNNLNPEQQRIFDEELVKASDRLATNPDNTYNPVERYLQAKIMCGAQCTDEQMLMHEANLRIALANLDSSKPWVIRIVHSLLEDNKISQEQHQQIVTDINNIKDYEALAVYASELAHMTLISKSESKSLTDGAQKLARYVMAKMSGKATIYPNGSQDITSSSPNSVVEPGTGAKQPGTVEQKTAAAQQQAAKAAQRVQAEEQARAVEANRSTEAGVKVNAPQGQGKPQQLPPPVNQDQQNGDQQNGDQQPGTVEQITETAAAQKRAAEAAQRVQAEEQARAVEANQLTEAIAAGVKVNAPQGQGKPQQLPPPVNQDQQNGDQQNGDQHTPQDRDATAAATEKAAAEEKAFKALNEQENVAEEANVEANRSTEAGVNVNAPQGQGKPQQLPPPVNQNQQNKDQQNGDQQNGDEHTPQDRDATAAATEKAAAEEKALKALKEQENANAAAKALKVQNVMAKTENNNLPPPPNSVAALGGPPKKSLVSYSLPPLSKNPHQHNYSGNTDSLSGSSKSELTPRTNWQGSAFPLTAQGGASPHKTSKSSPKRSPSKSRASPRKAGKTSPKRSTSKSRAASRKARKSSPKRSPSKPRASSRKATKAPRATVPKASPKRQAQQPRRKNYIRVKI